MKKVVDGKVFDTEHAEEIFYYSNGLSDHDFQYIRETLYRSNVSGQFFLVGEGGATTKYCDYYGGGTIEGVKVLALSPDEAIQFLSDRGGDEIVAELFDLPLA